jgi:hypothetical protein
LWVLGFILLVGKSYVVYEFLRVGYGPVQFGVCLPVEVEF